MSRTLAVSTLLPLTTDVLDPLFWQPTRLGVDSSWLGHVPFGHWLVDKHRPNSIVELGTRSGVSFAAFCEAILRCRITASALACDTRCSDSDAEAIKEEVANLRQFLNQHYAAVSTLMHCTCDGLLELVPDESVDLLHINATREHKDVFQLFSDWTHKLSSRAIVLIHPTNMRDDAHEVWRFWTKTSADYPHFEFLHGGGLGMLIVGKAVEGAARELCTLGDDDAANVVRQRFSILGHHWAVLRNLDRKESTLRKLRSENSKFNSELAEPRVWAERAKTEITPLSLTLPDMDGDDSMRRFWIPEASVDLAARDAQIITLTTERDTYAAQSTALLAEIARLTSCIDVTQTELDEFSQELTALEHERATILSSTSWRVTAPLRHLAHKVCRLVKGTQL